MNKKYALAVSLILVLLLVGAAKAGLSSYGSISGYVTVEPALTWDIIKTGSDINETDDITYSLDRTYQGETKWAKIKLKNSGDEPIKVNILTNSSSEDINLSIWNEEKKTQLTEVSIPPEDVYIWLKHEFSDSIEPGSYNFDMELVPTELN